MKVLIVDTHIESDPTAAGVRVLAENLGNSVEAVGLFSTDPTLKIRNVQTFGSKWTEFKNIRSEESPLFKGGWRQGRRLEKYLDQVRPDFERCLDVFSPDIVLLADIHLSMHPFGTICKQRDLVYVPWILRMAAYSQTEGAHLEGAETVLAASAAIRDDIAARFPEIYYRKLETLPLPQPDPSPQVTSRRGIRNRFETSNEAKVLLFPGSLEPDFGAEDLLDAFAEVVKHEEAVLWLIGSPEESLRAKLPRKGDELRIGNTLRFIGRPRDLDDVYRAADLMVYPPRNKSPEEGLVDGTGQSIVRAMGVGLAVVVTDSGGAPGWVLGTKAGAVVPPRDSAALAQTIRRFLADQDLRQKAGDDGLRRFANAAAAPQVAKRLRALLEPLAYRN